MCSGLSRCLIQNNEKPCNLLGKRYLSRYNAPKITYLEERMDTPTPEQISTYISAGIDCAHIHVEGDGRHFYATIVSPAFEGLRTLARQRAVYAVLGDRILGNDAQIHALSMKTFTPDEWAIEQSK